MAVFGKAQYIKRVEDDRLLTGAGGFTDNLNPAQSGAPRARRARRTPMPGSSGIDTAAARKAAGVVAVFTWKTWPGRELVTSPFRRCSPMPTAASRR